MLAECWGTAVQQWWKCVGICSQNTQSEWIMSDKVGFVFWAPWNQNVAWRHLEKKKPGIHGQTSVLFFFFFFPSLEKERICFCARWKERTFSVPEEFSRNFWFLHCLIALWSPVLGEAQPFLPPGSCSLEIWLAENFYFLSKTSTWTDRLFLFQLFSQREFVIRAPKIQSEIFLLEENKRELLFGSLGQYLSSDNIYYRAITFHPSDLRCDVTKLHILHSDPPKPLCLSRHLQELPVLKSVFFFSLKNKFSPFFTYCYKILNEAANYLAFVKMCTFVSQ